LRQIANNDPRAAHLIDGAVLTTTIAGRSAYFEADALATWSASRIHAAEVKSFPKVDDRVDPDKFGAAMDQVAIYILLARDAIAALGADSERLVSDKALLVTPKNVGLTPTLSEHAVGRRIERNRKVLNSIPIPDEVIAGVPTKLSFDRVADTQVEERVRLDVLNDIADRVGTCYEPTCLSTCGNARFCRERTFRFGAPMISGSAAVRLLPEVSTFHRVDELAQGALPSEPEAPAAVILERARRLYTEAASQGTATPLDATERKTA
jgi:hypothetical protein